MADYIVENLTKVKHTTIKCRICENTPESAKPNLKPQSMVVKSLRTDGVVSKVFHLSRNQSLLLFREKKVLVNGRVQENNSALLKGGDVVSVRGHGKFVFGEETHPTKKGNLNVQVMLYV